MDATEGNELDRSAVGQHRGSFSRDELERAYAGSVPALVAWMRMRLGAAVQREIEIEDLVQDTWLRACDSLTRFDPRASSFRTWLIGIAQNVLLEHLRRHLRGNMGVRVGGETAADRCPASVTSISRAAARDEGIERLLKFVEGLPTEERELIRLRAFEDWKLAHIAERIGLSEEATKKRWQRLCARLRELGIGQDLVVQD